MTSVFEKGNYSSPLALSRMLHKTTSPIVPFLVAIIYPSLGFTPSPTSLRL